MKDLQRRDKLRIAIIAGNLCGGGAEKQMWYMARALHESGVDVHVYSPAESRSYGPLSHQADFSPPRPGPGRSPAIRLAITAAQLYRIRPHIVQSGHFWANLYAGIAARPCRSITIGAMRNDHLYEIQDNGRWGPHLLRACSGIIANSMTAIEGAEAAGIPSSPMHYLPNVIDLAAFDAKMRTDVNETRRSDAPIVMAVGRLVTAKRFDRFLEALATARRKVPDLTGVIVGDGPERHSLEERADALGLLSHGVTFAGAREDVPAMLHHADMFALTSDHEGFPNVVLEAMSAGLPVVTTPAGDAGRIVDDGVSGYVIPFDRADEVAERIVQLARSPDLRRRMGQQARSIVEQRYGFECLASRLFGIYGAIARQQSRHDVLHLLPA